MLTLDPTELLGEPLWIGLDWVRLDWVGLDWIGLDWIGLDWIWLDWIGLNWIGLGWIGLGWIGLGWVGLNWIGLDWIWLDWIGLNWIGLGWIGLDAPLYKLMITWNYVYCPLKEKNQPPPRILRVNTPIIYKIRRLINLHSLSWMFNLKLQSSSRDNSSRCQSTGKVDNSWQNILDPRS